MTPCGISWCVALTDKQFCPAHEKNQALHPAEIDPEVEAEEAIDASYTEGFNAGKSEGDEEGYERGLADHD